MKKPKIAHPYLVTWALYKQINLHVVNKILSFPWKKRK